MLSNSMTFSNTSQHEIRVAFDPDGTAWYCCKDVADLLGYKAADKVIPYAVNKERSLSIEIRQISWFNTKGRFKRNFVSRIRCFDEKNVLAFLKRSAVQNQEVHWFINEVIPEARKRGAEIAKENASIQTQLPVSEEKFQVEEHSEPQTSQRSIAERLDAVILECVLLKQELCRNK